METLEQQMIRALDWRKVASNVGSVADTSFLMDLVTGKLWAGIVQKWLESKGVATSISLEVQREYEHYYANSGVDSEGVPKAPILFEELVRGGKVAYFGSRTVALPKVIVLNSEMSRPDKGLIADAAYFAEETGREVYLLTNDTAVIRSVQKSLAGSNIRVVMPSFVERELSALVLQLGLQMLVKSEALAQLYRLGSNSIPEGTRPYVVVERSQRVSYSNEVLTLDVATEVAFAEGNKSIPARTNMYGMPLVSVSLSDEEGRGEAIRSMLPYIPKGTGKFVTITPEQNFMPTIFRRVADPELVRQAKAKNVPRAAREVAKRGTRTELVEWARI